ncbi:MAG TPA: ClpXP protease specificity-enhancing factor SspB [Xanthobacteraceae bacterium]|nr:ClpXP protease specificity-enhancing factor SspB [Xanthobacteraceae bacterium]
MPVDHIRYDILTQEALRSVLRRVLTDAAKNGLPGDHHFYVSYATDAPGVRMSQRLRAQYPQEITIVLQHQFWDLTVGEDFFEIGLSFNGVPERLVVPFAAIKRFFDPSVQFGLQFETVTVEADAAEGEADTAVTADGDKKSAKPLPAAKAPAAASNAPAVQDTKPDAKSVAAEPEGEPPTPAGGAEVVRLDRFRKK